MTLTEAAKLVAILKGIYHREQFTEESPTAYHMLLDDLAYGDVLAAVKVHGRRSKWCPTPAELRDIITEQNVPEMSPGEAWQLVKRQINRHGYDSRGLWTFDNPAIAAAVTAVGHSHICFSEEQYARRDFEAAFKSAQDRQRRDVQDGSAAIGGGTLVALDRGAA